jgi:alkylation response protein AidB-like acyl-CoA dehydrogenase
VETAAAIPAIRLRVAPEPVSLEGLRRNAAQLLPEIASGAARRERERILPRAEIAAVAGARLASMRIPVDLGGAGGSVRDVMRLIIDMAAADPNVTQAVRGTFVFAEALLASEDVEHRARWAKRIAAGQLIGTANVELGGQHGAIATRITHDGEHFSVTGRKYYCTGALYADWVAGVATDENERRTTFIIPCDRAGLELVDDFDAMGQRLTASGTTVFDKVHVRADEITVLDSGYSRSIATTFGQLYLAAMQAGIARAVRDDAAAFARKHARTIKHSTADRAQDDPYVRLALGTISAQAYAAEAVVLAAADSLDAAWQENLATEALTAAAIAVASAQIVATEATLKAGETLFDTGSASTTSRALNFDRHWRNARTIANHNPRSWKASVVGNYWLTGEEPPTAGYF